jgi:hypothetical protein
MDELWLDMNITGLKKAGTYTGVIEISNADTNPVRQSFTINVREPGWYATLWILLSIVISLVVAYLPVLEKAQRLRARIYGTQTEIGKHSTPDLGEAEKGLLAALYARLDALIQDSDDKDQDPKVLETRYQQVCDIVKIFEDIVDLRRAIALLPEELARHQGETLDNALRALANAATSEAALKNLPNLRSGMMKALKEQTELKARSEDVIWFKDAEKADWEAALQKFLAWIPVDSFEPGATMVGVVNSYWTSLAAYFKETCTLAIQYRSKDASPEQAFQKVKDGLKEIVGLDLHKDRQKVLDDYRKYLGDYKQAKAPVTREMPMGGGPIRTILGWFAKPIREASGARPAPTPVEKKKREERRAWFTRLLIDFISLVVAVASGLFVLYQNDLTWGGLQDYLIALLWGLGLYQVSNASLTSFARFAGIKDVLKPANQGGGPAS